MKTFSSINDPAVAEILRAGGVGVVRTDTLYGVIARADDEEAVKRVYHLKERAEHKSPIVLIDDYDQLYDQPAGETSAFLKTVWPGPVSVVMPSSKGPLWIRRSNDSIAYRMPDLADLRHLVRLVGPLIAPSANTEGEKPALNVDEAMHYFGNNVDFYVDGGQVTDDSPSQLVRVGNNGGITQLR